MSHKSKTPHEGGAGLRPYVLAVGFHGKYS